MGLRSAVVVCLFVSFCSADIPSDFTRCKAEDSDCIAEAATQIIAKSSKGNEHFGIPSFDPYSVPSLLIDHENATRNVNLNLNLKDVTIHGISQFKFTKVVGFSKDPASNKYELYGDLPSLKVDGKYKTQGKVAQLAIKGEGPFSVTVENSKFGLKFKPTIVTRDGKRYLQIKKLKVKLQPSRVKIFIGNLFEGNEELTKQINEILNENWKDAWTEFEPNVMRVAEGVMKDIAQKFFDQIPYDELYLPD